MKPIYIWFGFIVLAFTILLVFPKDTVSSKIYDLAWQVVDSPTTNMLQDVDMISDSEGWAVGREGTIIHYIGDQWVIYDSPTDRNLWKISMVNANEGWALGENITLVFWNGVWSISDMYRPDQLYDIKMLSSEDGWIVGGNTGSIVMHYTRDEFGVLDWYLVDTVDMGPLRAIDMFSPTSGMVGGAGGGGPVGIWLYDNGIWSLLAGTSQTFNAISLTSPGSGWLISTSQYWRCIDAVCQEMGYVEQLHDLQMLSENDGWVIGGDAMGSIIKHYVPPVWVPIDISVTQWLSGIDMLSESDGWIVGQDGTILHYSPIPTPTPTPTETYTPSPTPTETNTPSPTPTLTLTPTPMVVQNLSCYIPIILR